MNYSVLAIIAAFGLSACGGSDDVVRQAGAPVTLQSGTPPSVTETSATSRRVGYQIGNTGRFASHGISRNPNRDVPGFLAFGGARDDVFLFEAKNESGTVRIAEIVDDTTLTATEFLGATATANGGTIPTNSSATYSGAYAGFLTRGPGTTRPGLTQSYFTGDVVLNADFGAGVVDGSIVNRERFLTTTGASAGSVTDISLGTLAIANGIAGGTVLIDHDYQNGSAQTPDDYIETGGFVATKQ